MTKDRLYWVSQFCGWTIYILLIWVINQLDGREMTLFFCSNLVSTFVLGIAISHVYRHIILRFNWLNIKIKALIPRVIISSFLCGFIYYFIHSFISDVVLGGDEFSFEPIVVLKSTLNLTINFLLWTLLYFLFHFIQNYRKEEIKNLQWQAHSREVELNKLKSQLNPHFIFNAMNTIRALVDENPEKSKQSITQLSNILRSSILMSRKKVIPLAEEIQLVRDYLGIEETRYEERLKVRFDIPEELMNYLIPPMIVQTLVENGIKHGISNLQEGGEISISAKEGKNCMTIEIENSGNLLDNDSSETGFGLINSKQRIQLLYGEKGQLTIQNTNRGTVLACLVIPKKPKRFKSSQTMFNF